MGRSWSWLSSRKPRFKPGVDFRIVVNPQILILIENLAECFQIAAGWARSRPRLPNVNCSIRGKSALAKAARTTTINEMMLRSLPLISQSIAPVIYFFNARAIRVLHIRASFIAASHAASWVCAEPPAKYAPVVLSMTVKLKRSPFLERKGHTSHCTSPFSNRIERGSFFHSTISSSEQAKFPLL